MWPCRSCLGISNHLQAWLSPLGYMGHLQFLSPPGITPLVLVLPKLLTQERICLFTKVEERALLSGPWLQTVPSPEPDCTQQVLSKCTM